MKTDPAALAAHGRAILSLQKQAQGSGYLAAVFRALPQCDRIDLNLGDSCVCIERKSCWATPSDPEVVEPGKRSTSTRIAIGDLAKAKATLAARNKARLGRT